jgi:hypothetical protein
LIAKRFILVVSGVASSKNILNREVPFRFRLKTAATGLDIGAPPRASPDRSASFGRRPYRLCITGAQDIESCVFIACLALASDIVQESVIYLQS